MKTQKQKLTAVKSWRFEIVDLAPESRRLWHELQDQAREAVNMWWQLWEAAHIAAGSRAQLRAWRKAYAQAREDRRAPPKCPVNKMPHEAEEDGSIYQQISHALRCDYPSGTLETKTLGQLIKTSCYERLGAKDCDGVWNLWQSVLLNRQGRPSAQRDQPIPFNCQTSTLPERVDSREEDGRRGSKWRFHVKAGRQQVDSKSTCDTIQQSFTILAKGSGHAIISRIASGEYEFKGSKIFYSESKRKWFASLCYAAPIAPKGIPGDGRAILIPGRYPSLPWDQAINASWPSGDVPWRFIVNGRWNWRGGRGRHIAATRRNLLTNRWSHQESYRWAGSQRKGHGRKRALGPVGKLKDSWQRAVTNANRQLVSEIVKECIEKRVGTLVYVQPTDKFKESRFLSIAGKINGRRDESSWGWAQVATLLSSKCKDAGIHLTVYMSGSRAATYKSEKNNGNKRVMASKKRTTRKTVRKDNVGTE